MPKETKSKFAILGMISKRPRSGYGIKREIEKSIGFFWSESYGQIYPILKQLVAEGLATVNPVESQGKPDKFLYSISEAGQVAFQEWLTEPAEHPGVRIELLLKLFFGNQVPLETTIRQVERYQDWLLETQKEYAEVEKLILSRYDDEPDFPYWQITLSFGKKRNAADLEWCQETLAMLRKLQIDKSDNG